MNKLLLTLVLSILIIGLSQPAMAALLFEDDFESYDLGIIPYSGGWQSVFSDYHLSAISNDGLDGGNAFTIVASSGYGQAYGIPLSPYHDHITYELDAKAVTPSPNAGSSGMGLFYRTDPSNGISVKDVGFLYSPHQIYVQGSSNRVDYQVGEWYHIVVHHNFIDNTADVWVDGTLVDSGVPLSYTNYHFLSIGANWGWIVAYDNVMIYDTPPNPQTGPIIYVDPANQDQYAGATFSVDINVDPQLSEVYSGQYEVHFDPAKLEVLSQTSGNFLSQDGADTLPFGGYDNVLGIATYGETRAGVQTGVTNPGTLATITLRVKDQAEFGETTLNLMNVILSDTTPEAIPDIVDHDGIVNIPENIPPESDCGLDILGCENVGTEVSFNGSGSYDSDGTIQSYDWNFGDGNSGNGVTPTHTYTVPNYDGYTVTLTVTDDNGAQDSDTSSVVIWIAGDANGDRTVNILDAALIGLHWGETSDNPNFSPCADLNNDNVINILDAALIGLHWGETLPQN